MVWPFNTDRLRPCGAEGLHGSIRARLLAESVRALPSASPVPSSRLGDGAVRRRVRQASAFGVPAAAAAAAAAAAGVKAIRPCYWQPTVPSAWGTGT